MPGIEEELHKEEEIEKELMPHPLAYLHHYIIGGLIGIITFFLIAIP